MANGGCCRAFSDYSGIGCCIGENDYKKTALAEITQNKDRHCTDIPCLLIGIVIFISQLYLIIYASDEGADPDALLYGYDYNGKWCNNDHEDGNLNAWVNVLDSFTIRTCVDSCSQTSISNSDDDTSKIITSYESENFLDAYCVPMDMSIYETFDDFTTTEQMFERGISDINKAKWMIFISAFLAIIFSYIYLKLIECIGGFIIWTTIILLYLGGLMGAIMLIDDGVESYNEDTTSDTAKWEVALGILIILLLAFGACALIWIKKRIDLALQILDEASDAIRDIKTTLIFPLVYSIPVIGYLVFCIAVALYIYSVQETHTKTLSDDIYDYTTILGESQYIYYDFDEGLQDVLLYHVVTFVYMMQFIIYFGFMVLAGTIADWYFSKWNANETSKIRGNGKAEFSHSPIIESLWRVFRYHMGSLSFGALIITIIRIIRASLQYLEKKCKSAGVDKGLVKCVFCCVKCCLACCQCILDKCCKEGFIFCSVYGTNFCYSSYQAIKLIWKNIGRTTMVEGISKYMEIIGRLGISLLTTGISVIVFKEYTYYQNNLSSIMYPMIVVFLISYIIASIFMTVFEVAVDTIFLCFLIDEEVNGATQFASRTLSEFAAKHGTSVGDHNRRQQVPNDENDSEDDGLRLGK